MTEIQKSIEIFLKENNLEETLREFKHERRQSPTASGKSYQQLLQIHKVHLKNDRETENRLREYLQKADGKTLKRFVDRARKIKQTAMKDIDPCIVELPFFRKMLEKVDANCELKAINK